VRIELLEKNAIIIEDDTVMGVGNVGGEEAPIDEAGRLAETIANL
jgi:hypothetical protein